MSNNCLVCDLDGTLLDYEGRIDEQSLAKIKTFIAKGGNFIICTGRLDQDIIFIEKKLGIKSKYRISQNGAVIKDDQNQFVLVETIPDQAIKKINEIVFDKKVRTEVSNVSNRFFPSPRLPEELGEFVDTSIVVSDLEKVSRKIQPTIFLMFGNDQVFEKIKTDIKEQAISEIQVVQTSPNSLEIFSKNISKGRAVSFLMKQLSIIPEQLYVAGDAESDTSMFGYTNHSFAVGLANSEVRNQATKYVRNVGEIFNYMSEVKLK